MAASRCSGSPSNNSNGNTFDFQGRQLSCEHLTRRVVRYEHDGSVTIIADSFEGKRFNSPNDVVPHPDGSYWFTDPPYGGQLYEGQPDAPGGPANRGGTVESAARPAGGGGQHEARAADRVYRVDPSGKVDRVITEEQVPDPNGLAFSPDYKRLYVVSTGRGPGDTGPGGKGDLFAFDVAADNTLSNRTALRRLHDRRRQVRSGRRALRCRRQRLVLEQRRPRGGLQRRDVWTPEGKLIGRIRLPEVCGNVCFGGPKRNRLFMAASQSLYALYVNTQGAAPG